MNIRWTSDNNGEWPVQTAFTHVPLAGPWDQVEYLLFGAQCKQQAKTAYSDQNFFGMVCIVEPESFVPDWPGTCSASPCNATQQMKVSDDALLRHGNNSAVPEWQPAVWSAANTAG